MEIGTYDGSKIINLKKCFPNIRAFGLDICENFKNSFIEEEVQFSLFEESFFRRDFVRPLVISAGTLSYFSRPDLEAFSRLISENRFDIAIYEPVCCFDHGESLLRSDISFYHPYHEFFEELGYKWAETKQGSIKKNYAPGYAEYWYTNLALSQ